MMQKVAYIAAPGKQNQYTSTQKEACPQWAMLEVKDSNFLRWKDYT